MSVILWGKNVSEDTSKETVLIPKDKNMVVNDVESNFSNKEKFVSDNFITPEDIKKERAKYPSGIKIISLDESNASDQNKAMLKRKFNNLKKYGNYNSDKLGSEFKHIKKYRNNIGKDYPLSFTPVENEYLESNFNLTGKFASGVYSKGMGFNSYTRLFENKENGQKVELTEMYLNPKTHSFVEVYKESFNKRIDGLDLTFQEIPVGNTTVYTVDFFNNQKMYSLSTIKVEKKDVESLVISLIRESNNFRN